MDVAKLGQMRNNYLWVVAEWRNGDMFQIFQDLSLAAERKHAHTNSQQPEI